MSSRRSNKSHKVPNVKLRPVQPSTPSGSKRPKRNTKKFSIDLARTRTEDSGFDSDQETSFTDHVPRPFKKVILCATGVDDKTSIFKQAIELGAQPLQDLTDKVTHLLAVEPGSAKYRCALEMRLPIMHPSWITKSHEIWLKGDDVDFVECCEKYRLPIFEDVTITLSGVEPLETRTRINKLVTTNGGTYVKNIERPVRVTHLLCGDECVISDNDPQGRKKSDKVKYAHKFNERKEANISIVWEEWFWDSIAFGGRFAEDEYLISKPRPKRKVMEGVTSPSRASTPGDAPQSPTEIPPSSPSETPLTLPVIQPRKSAVSTTLGPLQEDEEEEMVTVKRVPTVTLQIWGDLLKTRGFDVVKGKLVRSPSKANPRTQALHTQIQELASPLRGKSQDPLGNNDVDAAEGPRSALASFRRTKSLAAFASNLKDSSTSKQLLQRDSTVFIANAAPSSLSLSGVPPPLDEPLEGLVEESDELPALPAAGPSIDRSQTKEQRNVGRKGKGANKSGLFSGLTFHVLGEAKSPSVRSAVEEGGGTLLPTSGEGGTENDEDVDYILVRLVSGSKIFREDLDHTQRRKYRTECWLERCLFEERICNPEEHISFVPLGTEIPIPGAENLSLSFSGLTQSESCWIKRLIRALGIPLAPNFSRRTTHLLCPTREGTKYEKALEWAIPVVDMEWLGAIAQSGVVPFVSKSAPGGDVPQEKPISSMKGKERAVDIGGMDVMLDRQPSPERDNHSAKNEGTDHLSIGKAIEPMFGLPSGLLSGPRYSEPEPRSSQPPPSTPPQPRSSLSRRNSTPSPALSYMTLIPEPSSSAAIREEMKSLSIPSSNTPSPMKHPSAGANNGGDAGVPKYSPTKISRETSKVLQESITSLLGKRRPSEDDLVTGVNRGKRAKPIARTKSKQDALPFLNPDGAAADISPPDGIPFEHPSILSDGDVNMLPLEEDGMSDNGIGVTYADPNQIKERRRLMELLETKQKEPWDVEDEPQAVRPRPAGSKGGGRAKNVKKSGSRTAGGSRRGSRTTTS